MDDAIFNFLLRRIFLSTDAWSLKREISIGNSCDVASISKAKEDVNKFEFEAYLNCKKANYEATFSYDENSGAMIQKIQSFGGE